MMERKAKSRGNRVSIAQPKNAFKKLGAFVPKHHAEKMIVDDFFHALRNASEQFFAIENGRDFAADVVEKRQGNRRLWRGQKKVRGYRISVVPERECSGFG